MFCPECGTSNETSFKWCVNCGHKLPVLAKTNAIPAPVLTPDPFPVPAPVGAPAPGRERQPDPVPVSLRPSTRAVHAADSEDLTDAQHSASIFAHVTETNTGSTKNEVPLTPTSEEALAAFVGDNWLYGYKDKFLQFSKPGTGIIGFHVVAFFVTALWLLYRKMWGSFLIYWLLMGALGAMSGALARNNPGTGFEYAGLIITVIMMFVTALFADRLYFNHARNTISKILRKSSGDSREITLQKIAKSGGTSKAFWILIAVAVIGIASAIALPLMAKRQSTEAPVAEVRQTESPSLKGTADVAITAAQKTASDEAYVTAAHEQAETAKRGKEAVEPLAADRPVEKASDFQAFIAKMNATTPGWSEVVQSAGFEKFLRLNSVRQGRFDEAYAALDTGKVRAYVELYLSEKDNPGLSDAVESSIQRDANSRK